MLLQVDQTRLALYQLQNLSLPIHHVFVLEDLFDGDNFFGFLDLSLVNFAKGSAAQDLQEVVVVEFACLLLQRGEHSWLLTLR